MIFNTDMWNRTNQSLQGNEIISRKWADHVLRREQYDIVKMSLDWSPQGKRKQETEFHSDIKQKSRGRILKTCFQPSPQEPV